MSNIDYFFSPVSTFAYLAGNRLEQVAAVAGATITYKPFDIMSVFAKTGGLPLGERHETRQQYRLQELVRIAKRNDLPINLAPKYFPTNPAPSSYAIIAAQAAGGDVGGLVQALFSGIFAEDQDIAEEAVIRCALEQAGFDPDLVDTGLMLGAEIYGANTEEALKRGVFGSPFYLVGEEKFWGQDRLSYLADHLKEIA